MNDIIYNFDLFIFDFDGTILDTEPIHYESYLESIMSFQSHNYLKNDLLEKEFTYSIYEKYCHSLNLNDIKLFLSIKFNIDDYNSFYKLKQQIYEEKIKNEDRLKYIDGFEMFLNKIIYYNKPFIIVTNSSKQNLDYFQNIPKFHLLKKTLKIFTKEDFKNKKPHPECYLKIHHLYPQFNRKIGFEDSLRGFHSLIQLKNHITPCLIQHNSYHYFNHIYNHYNNIRFYNIKNYERSELTNTNNIMNNFDPSIINNFNIHYENNMSIDWMIENYIRQINNNKIIIKNIIEDISIIINNNHKYSNIFLTGMGKSGYICKKSASTWQSLSIPCIYLDLPNLPHGDFGILKDGDIIIFISNSGNTEEIIYILKYLNENFNKNITKICITANKENEMQKYCDYSFNLNNIRESDTINMTPSNSSSLFMMILDYIGIYIKNNITKDEFKLNHPAGSLGKII